ncbi:MAG: multicomponent Na+:H+ antiporter subunit B [Cryomorphaceae bacterium]|jgi:multicomponent Na+:H+ antiporter subunit B
MIAVFGAFLLTLMVITAIAIVRTENLFVAVMLTSIFSLLMAANFFILDAADVALTEAAVGAGVTTVIFLSALALTGARERSPKSTSWLTVAVVSATVLVLVYATFDKPRLGDPNAPVHQHVAPWYLENTPKLIEIPNVVTAILASYRGYDTLGEVFVVLAACIGVLFLLSASHGGRQAIKRPVNLGLRHHLIPQVVGRLLVPFIILFGLYVQFHGEYGPGGGFQAGAIIASAFILHALLEGESAALLVIPRGVLLGMAAGGALLYGGVGLLGIAMGGNFLDYSVLFDDPVRGQQIGIIVIEAGVGITVCGGLLSIFHAFAARELS